MYLYKIWLQEQKRKKKQQTFNVHLRVTNDFHQFCIITMWVRLDLQMNSSVECTQSPSLKSLSYGKYCKRGHRHRFCVVAMCYNNHLSFKCSTSL